MFWPPLRFCLRFVVTVPTSGPFLRIPSWGRLPHCPSAPISKNAATACLFEMPNCPRVATDTSLPIEQTAPSGGAQAVCLSQPCLLPLCWGLAVKIKYIKKKRKKSSRDCRGSRLSMEAGAAVAAAQTAAHRLDVMYKSRTALAWRTVKWSCEGRSLVQTPKPVGGRKEEKKQWVILCASPQSVFKVPLRLRKQFQLKSDYTDMSPHAHQGQKNK